MITARRNKLPDIIRANKCHGLSVMSFMKHLGLPDGAEFRTQIEVTDDGIVRLILTPLDQDAAAVALGIEAPITGEEVFNHGD